MYWKSIVSDDYFPVQGCYFPVQGPRHSALYIFNYGSTAPNAFVAAWISLSTSRSEELASVTVVL